MLINTSLSFCSHSYTSAISVQFAFSAGFVPHVVIGAIQKGFLYLICHGLEDTYQAKVMKTFINFLKEKDLNLNSETKNKQNTQTQNSSVTASFLLESRYAVKMKEASVI